MKSAKKYIESVLNRKISRLIGAVLMIGGAQPAGAATIANYYQVIDLGTFGGETSWATSINDHGQIVGHAADSTGQQRVFLYENGVMKDIGVDGGTPVFINNKGQIAGNIHEINKYGFSAPSKSFLYDNGNIAILNIIDGHIKGINNNGDIIGDIYNVDSQNDSRAFVVRDGVVTDLGTLVGGDRAWVSGINDKGQIVGWSATTSTANPYGAFIYENGIMSALNFLEGQYGNVSNINNNGDIIGMLKHENGPELGYLYNGNLNLYSYGDIELHYLATPLDVNNDGLVVGNTGGPFAGAAALFKDGVMFDLNDLVVGYNPFNILLSAESINDRGQIVGYGITSYGLHAFLMNPVSIPEPGIAALVVCLGMGFAFRPRARRRR